MLKSLRILLVVIMVGIDVFSKLFSFYYFVCSSMLALIVYSILILSVYILVYLSIGSEVFMLMYTSSKTMVLGRFMFIGLCLLLTHHVILPIWCVSTVCVAKFILT